MFEFLLAILSGILAVVCVGRILKQTAPKEEAQKVYNAFRDAGGNFIDTANVYTNGASERFAGEFAKGHRQSMVLATKYSNAVPGNDPNAAGNQRKSLMQAVEASCSGCRRITSIKALHPYYDN